MSFAMSIIIYLPLALTNSRIRIVVELIATDLVPEEMKWSQLQPHVQVRVRFRGGIAAYLYFGRHGVDGGMLIFAPQQ